jgi:hypothetical protein
MPHDGGAPLRARVCHRHRVRLRPARPQTIPALLRIHAEIAALD